jgi:hypothetical protein
MNNMNALVLFLSGVSQVLTEISGVGVKGLDT